MTRSEPMNTSTAGEPLNLTWAVPPSLTKPVPLIWIWVTTQLPDSSGIQSVEGVKPVIDAPRADPANSRAQLRTAPLTAVRNVRLCINPLPLELLDMSAPP